MMLSLLLAIEDMPRVLVLYGLMIMLEWDLLMGGEQWYSLPTEL